MKAHLIDLWNGRIPLATAFWHNAIIYGSLANLIATVATFAAVAAGFPVTLAVAIHLLPAPYNVAVAVGVSRSATRYTGPKIWADLSRIAVVIWAIVATAA